MPGKCRELEEPFGTGFAADIIHNKELRLKIVKKILYEEDKNARLEKCRDKAPFINTRRPCAARITVVAVSLCVSVKSHLKKAI